MFKKIHVEINILQFLKRFLLWTLSKIKAYEQVKRKRSTEDLLFISFHEDGVYLNKVKIIDKKSAQQIELLKLIIIEQTKAALISSKKLDLLGMNCLRQWKQ